MLTPGVQKRRLHGLAVNPPMVACAIAVALAAGLPVVVGSQYVMSVGFQTEAMMCLALGLNLVVGYAGLLDLGYAAFLAIGAYTTGVLTTRAHWSVLATLPPALIAGVLSALVVGATTLRLRSDYLAIITLGFGEIVQAVANNLSLTGGPTGIFGIAPLSIGGSAIVTDGGYFYVFLFMVVALVLASTRLRHSRLGRAWLCIREDEDAAQAMGIKTYRYKTYAYVAGAVVGSLTGCIYASAITAVSPVSFGIQESLLVLMAVALGGMGSIPGVLLGAAIVVILPEVLRQFAAARLLVFGGLLIVMMMFRPHGLLPEGGLLHGRDGRRRWSPRRMVSTRTPHAPDPDSGEAR